MEGSMKLRRFSRLTTTVSLVLVMSAACSNLQGAPNGNDDTGNDTGGQPTTSSRRVHLESEFTYEGTGIGELAMHEALSLPPITMEAGEQAILEAQADVSGPDGLNQPILVSARVSCRRTNSTFAQGVWTWKNWEGDNRQPDGVVVRVRDVFTAPQSGDYVCTLELLSGAGAGVPDDTFMLAKSGADNTWLSFTPYLPSGQSHWIVDDQFDIDTGESAKVLEHTFMLLDEEGEYTIISDVQLSSCPPTAVSRAWCTIEGTTNVSKVRSRLHVVQLADDGVSECRRWSSPSSGSVSLDISNELHHAKAFHDLAFSADPQCGSSIETWVEVTVAGGNPVRVEDRIGSGELSIGGAVARP
jgi:hypothetical protein